MEVLKRYTPRYTSCLLVPKWDTFYVTDGSPMLISSCVRDTIGKTSTYSDDF